MPARKLEREAQFLGSVLQRYAAFMAVIAGQGAIDALEFVCEEAARDVASSGLPDASTASITAELVQTRHMASQAFAAAQRH